MAAPVASSGHPLPPSQKQFVDRFLFEDPQGEKSTQFRKAYRLDSLAASFVGGASVPRVTSVRGPGTARLQQDGELDKLLRLAEWTYGQFYLFGRPTLQTENAQEILAACAAGHTFYCAHYAIVFCAAATALGWVARPISVRRADENYRLSNHNIVEVWSKERERWVCFEPTYGGCVAIEGEPVSAYEAARQWFTRQAEGLQVILGPRRQAVTKKDFPYLLRKYPQYGWTKIDERSFTCYACLAWVPTNRLLGQHAGQSIENWDHWKDIYVYFGAERGWKEEPSDLPPYYPATAV